ncbi:nitroreductase family protein [Neptunomonas phycophila]|uniref:nitroreductase family protein n=1 Tax=Neptunomonas phycophila TaxID=1572645 RepID=UPI0023F73F77|nr:nitroreductase family protein [Neptunomonas phycophila]
MQTFEAITSRRAVKHFDPEHVLTADEERELLSLAVLSPTAFNIQNWRFVVVKDKALREQIRAAAWDQAQVTDSSLLVIMCADLKAWEKEPERYWANTDQGTRDILLPAIDNYYRGKEKTQRDEAMRSCGMAAQTLMLTAKSMGYDSCPMDGFDFDAVGKLIKLPEDHVISMFVAIGKATKEAHPRGGQLPLTDVVVTDTF